MLRSLVGAEMCIRDSDGSVSLLRGIGLFNQSGTKSFLDWYAVGGPLKCYNKDGNVWTYTGKARTTGNTRGD